MTAVRRVLIGDGDILFRRTLAEQLGVHDEFLTNEAETGSMVVETALAQTFDLIILGTSLRDMEGSDLCKMLRHTGMTTPIILLTTLKNSDPLAGISIGANDCVAKPFRISTLLARVRAQVREYEQGEQATYQIGAYSFSPIKKCLLDVVNNKQIRLTDKETAIIKFLYLAGNRTVSRDVLLGEVWGYSAGVTTHTLETHIYRLRQKIEREPSAAQLLLTELNGYRLVP
jgi:DNA-binding response OmpR family regulator